jgi:uncharacterized protein YbjQ (UPF0145 family)
MHAQPFWISTGDIRENYSVLNIVTGHAAAATPAFGQPDYARAHKDAIDNLTRSATQLGANGVIWIRFSQLVGAFGFAVFATGTAVKVSADT